MFDLLFHSFFRRLSLVCCRITWGLLEGLLLRPVLFEASVGASFFTESMGKHFSGFTNEPYLGLQAKYRCPSTDPSFFPGLKKKMYKLVTSNSYNDLRKICSLFRGLLYRDSDTYISLFLGQGIPFVIISRTSLYRGSWYRVFTVPCLILETGGLSLKICFCL